MTAFRFVVLGEDTGGRLVPGGLPNDDRRFHRTLRYLRRAETVIRDERSRGADALDPEKALVVPRGYRTDGDWVWPFALEYYLEHHGVAPPAELAALIAGRGFWPPVIRADRTGQAHQALLPRMPGPFEPAAPIQFRFPPDIYDVLVTCSWEPGRDVAPVADSGATAGRAILAEFGGLTIPVYGYGRDWPVAGFQLLPDGAPSDPARIAAAAARIGGPLTPLGSVYDWKSEIVLHPSHGIGTVGEVDRFLGRDIDEALTSLIRGVAPPEEHRRATGWLG